jgi:branched-chain amino acid transport system ATP-binding protein
MSEALLSVNNIETYYGRIQALRGVDLVVNQGEIVAMIGANGAGKTTLMMTVCGNPRARSGSIIFDGHDITNLPTHEIMHMSIAQSPEGRRIFPRMSVLENLQMGAILSDEDSFDADLQEVFDLFPILKKRESQRGGTLSGGEQQMLAIARALMAHPQLILLDEPSMGLSPILVQEVFRIINDIREAHELTFLLVEQNVKMALQVADHGYVLEQGSIRLEGTAEELRQEKRLQEFYLGISENENKVNGRAPPS